MPMQLTRRDLFILYMLAVGGGELQGCRALALWKSACHPQDFCKEVDIYFHDHMRGRGTSLNFADLATDPPPANLQVLAALTWTRTHAELSHGRARCSLACCASSHLHSTTR